jgi:hypothetical protein
MLMFFLKNFSKLFAFVIREQDSPCLKFKICPYLHGFPKFKSIIINVVNYVDFISALFGSQRQADAICFDL